jgi:hypothetical protein
MSKNKEDEDEKLENKLNPHGAQPPAVAPRPDLTVGSAPQASPVADPASVNTTSPPEHGLMLLGEPNTGEGGE